MKCCMRIHGGDECMLGVKTRLSCAAILIGKYMDGAGIAKTSRRMRVV
jgi:hypothetical protein